jgi:hypothetical protein
MRRAVVLVALITMLSACGHARPAASHAPAVATPPPTPAHSPIATIENLPSPSPLIAVSDREGNPVVEALPSPGVTSAISGEDAVDAAWAWMGNRWAPSSVVADFGMDEGHPSWFVTFYGICFPHPAGPPDQSPGPTCDPQITVEIDATRGDWIHSYYYG